MGLKNWEEIKSEFEGADLLLGNGFSIAIYSGFNYKKLYDQFERNCSPDTKKLFDAFGTANFEEILQNLEIANIVISALDEDLNLKDFESEVKLGLINAINHIHPKPGDIDNLGLSHLSTQFEYFGNIFTTNYDILLYNIAI